MKITLVISSLSSGGAERVLSNLTNYWDKKGHNVTVITLAADKPFYPLSGSIRLRQIDKISADGEKFLTRICKIAKRIYFLRKTIQKSEADVVVSFVDVMNIITLIACFGLNIPVIVSERTNPFFYNISLFYNHLRGCFYPNAKKVIVQTQSAARYFKKLKNIVIIPNAVQKNNQITRDYSQPVTHIISVGRLCPHKGFSTLIKAFSEVLISNPNLILTICGEGPDRANLESLIKSLNIGDNAFLPGAVSDINSVLLNSDFFVFPSHYEGFPNALCEAMAAGLPVIASNCSGNIDIVQDGVNGRLFPVGDVDMLVALMRELISDSLQRQKLSENAVTLSDLYSPDKIYQLWDAVVEEAAVSQQN